MDGIDQIQDGNVAFIEFEDLHSAFCCSPLIKRLEMDVVSHTESGRTGDRQFFTAAKISNLGKTKMSLGI